MRPRVVRGAGGGERNLGGGGAGGKKNQFGKGGKGKRSESFLENRRRGQTKNEEGPDRCAGENTSAPFTLPVRQNIPGEGKTTCGRGRGNVGESTRCPGAVGLERCGLINPGIPLKASALQENRQVGGRAGELKNRGCCVGRQARGNG